MDLADGPHWIVGRYALYGKLAAGGMATVHFGRLLGPAGFSRTVAIKRLHPQFSKDPQFVAMFLDEARLAARIQHPNVVATLDVVARDEELFLVMDYIRGESFSRLLRGSKKRGVSVELGVVASVASGMLHGLHAAHEAKDERGQPLSVVHRDVSPQNILVGTDGVARVLDFGVAKAAARVQITRKGQMKGKLSYMAPEQLQGHPVDRRTDVFSAGIVLWEAVTGQRLFKAADAASVFEMIVRGDVAAPSSVNAEIEPALDRVVLRALAKEPSERFQTARDFAIAIEEALPMASARGVGEWVERVAGETLLKREQTVAEIESISTVSEVSMRTSDPHFMRTLDGRSSSLGEIEAGRRLVERAVRARQVLVEGPDGPVQPLVQPNADDGATRVQGRGARKDAADRARALAEGNATTGVVPDEGGATTICAGPSGPAVPTDPSGDSDRASGVTTDPARRFQATGRHAAGPFATVLQRYRRATRRRVVLFGAIVLILAVALVWFLGSRRPSRDLHPSELRNEERLAESAGAGSDETATSASAGQLSGGSGETTSDRDKARSGLAPLAGDRSDEGRPGNTEVGSAAGATPRPRSTRRARATATAESTPSPAAERAPTAQCRQPFRIDEEGIRRIKPECL